MYRRLRLVLCDDCAPVATAAIGKGMSDWDGRAAILAELRKLRPAAPAEE